VSERKACLELDRFSAGYTDTPIVRELSLTVPAGTVTTLLGGNGAGKSTLLKAIFGMVRQFGGSIRFQGESIDRLTPDARLRAGIGIVPQGRCNFPRMTVRENLEMGAYLLSTADKRRAMAEVLELFPMLKQKHAVLAGNLSGGEQQILETAMVLEVHPRLLLLDEPSLGLSPKMQRQVFDSVAQLRYSGLTVMMVEQNLVGALLISDTAVVLETGRKFKEGPAAEIMNDADIKRAYLGGTHEEVSQT
jgi:branched-chain amino acid transport system ATP-binding protein